MTPLGSLILLTALTGTGYSIICQNCWQISDQPCTSPTRSCPAGNVCVASYSFFSVEGLNSSEYSVTCGTSDQCNVTASFTFLYGKVMVGTSCCSTDNCSPPYPALPAAISTQKNGLTCRTCFSDASDYCYTSDTIACSGQETKCALISKKLAGSIFVSEAARGCATKSYCDVFGNQVATLSGLYINSKIYCSDGAVGLYTGFLHCALAILLAKFLL